MNHKIPFLENNLQKIAPLGCSCLAISNDQSTANLFVKHCDGKNTAQFLNNILMKIPATKDTLDVRWSIQSIIGALDQIINDDISVEMATNDFSNLKDQTTRQIMPYISVHKQINDKTAHNISFYLMLLRNERPGIFYNILPQLQPLMTYIRNDRLFKSVGFEMLSFCIEPPIDFFEEIQRIDENQIPSLFQFVINYQSPEFTHFLQSKFNTDFQYPTPFPCVQNPVYFSLLNGSIERRRHFLDLVGGIVSDAIINADIETVKRATSMFPEILPYFMIVNQAMMYSDLESFVELLETKYPPSPATNVLERFKNDFHLLQLMSMLTGTDFCSGDLLTNSLPYHIQTALDKTGDILDAAAYKYFSLSDKAADQDFDFIRSHAALKLFFSVWKKPTPSLNNILDQICNFIKTTVNVVQRSLLVLDIFSLIFVKDKKDGNFVCSPYVAYKLVQKISQFDVSPYVTGAAALFESKKPHKSDTSLAPWFDRDPSIIYNAIESNNWDLADKMTIYLPYYRRIFTRAHSAYLYLEEGIEPDKTMTKLDVGLSSFGTVSVLKELEPHFPSFAPIIDERIKNPNDSIIDPIVAAEKWNPVNVFVNMFDTTPLEMVKSVPLYEGTTKISKSLAGFLHYVSLYYTCARCGDFIVDSLDDLFVFDMKTALAGPIKVGEYRKAEELAGAAHIDLLPFIFENIDNFEFDPSFMSKMCKEFPIETNALAISRKNSAAMDSQILKISNYMNCQNASKTEPLPTYSQLMQTNSLNLDDVIYKTDHKEIYNLLLKNSDEKISASLYQFLDIVSYVAPESDFPRLDRISMLHSIRVKSTSKNPSDIITDVMAHNDFELALKYLRTCVPSTAIAAPLCQLFTSSLSDLTVADRILQEYPERYDVILSRFFHIPGILSLLKKYAPEDKKSYLNGLSLLPDLIFSDSNIFEIETVTASYVRNYQCIFDMTPEIAVLFTDDNLFSIVKGVSIITEFHHICAHLYNLFRDKSTLVDFWVSNVEEKLHTFVIDSISKEDELNSYFRKLHHPMRVFQDPKCTFLNALIHLASFNPYSRLGIVYSFENYGSPSFVNKMHEVCNRIDDELFAKYLSESFNLNIDLYYLELARIQLLFGQYNDAATLLQKRSLKIDKYSKVSTYDTTYCFLTPLNKLRFFNQNELSANSIEKLGEGVVTPVNVYKYLVQQSRSNQTPPNAKIQKMMFSMIMKNSSPEAAISMLVSFRQFDTAYDLLKQQKDRQKRADLFLYSYFFAALFNNTLSLFSKYIEKVDPNLDETSFYWEEMIKFFDKNQMSYGLFHVYTTRNQLEDAALIGVDVFRKCESFDTQVSLLGQIIYCLDKSLTWRDRPQSCSPPFIKSDTSRENLVHIKDLSSVQLQICSICIEQGTAFSHDYDIISSTEGAINVAAILYLNRQVPLLNEVMKLRQVTMKDISSKVCEVLSKEPFKRIKEFWSNLKNHKQSLGNNLSYNLLKALAMSTNRQYIPAMIFSCFTSPEEQCLLLLEYDYTAESFSIAHAAGLKEYIPVIAHRAAILGNTEIYENCVRAL